MTHGQLCRCGHLHQVSYWSSLSTEIPCSTCLLDQQGKWDCKGFRYKLESLMAASPHVYTAQAFATMYVFLVAFGGICHIYASTFSPPDGPVNCLMCGLYPPTRVHSGHLYSHVDWLLLDDKPLPPVCKHSKADIG